MNFQEIQKKKHKIPNKHFEIYIWKKILTSWNDLNHFVYMIITSHEMNIYGEKWLMKFAEHRRT